MEIYIRGGRMNSIKPVKISFFGPSGSGKSTASQCSRKIFGELLPIYWFKECDVAEPLHIIQNHIYREMGIKSMSQDGELLQYLAEKFEKDLGPKCVDRVRKFVYAYQGKVICVNSDCRNNAYKCLKDNGFVFVRIQTDPFIRASRLSERGDITIANNSNSVEGIDQIEANYTIFNDGTLDSLNEHIRDLLIKKIIPSL